MIGKPTPRALVGRLKTSALGFPVFPVAGDSGVCGVCEMLTSARSVAGVCGAACGLSQALRTPKEKEPEAQCKGN